MRAVDELGYTPHGVARSLRMGKTRTVGLVLPDITNPHFAAMASAIEVACDAAGYTLMLCNTTDDPEKELRLLRLMRTQRVDGIILVPSGAAQDAALLRQAITAPTVIVDRTMDGLDFDAVLLDNRAASRMVVEYLIGAATAGSASLPGGPAFHCPASGSPAIARRCQRTASRSTNPWSSAASSSPSPPTGRRSGSCIAGRGRRRSSRPATTPRSAS